MHRPRLRASAGAVKIRVTDAGFFPARRGTLVGGRTNGRPPPDASGITKEPSGVVTMIFDNANPDTCPRGLAMDVADELREHIHDLYARQHKRNQETDGGMANAVLAGLTAVWLEAVHASWNTMLSESAISVLRGMSPEDQETKRSMKWAARDFLRRSGWCVRRSQ